MRLLANENFPADAVIALRRAGHDVARIHEDAAGSSDRAVLARGQHERRLIVTFDKDFGEMAFRLGLQASEGVILFGVKLSSPERVAALAVSALAIDTTWIGQFAVVEDDRIRFRPLPS